MENKAKIFFVLLVLFIAGCSMFKEQKDISSEKATEIKKPALFVSVPITKFSAIQCPCVEVEIQGTTFTMELDLGFRGDVNIAHDLIEQIPLKEFVRAKPMYGIRGKEYIKNLYKIEEARIGEIYFLKPFLQEDSEEFKRDSVFVKNGGEPSPPEAGRLGWELFYHTNLLIDVKNSKIAFCDSLETLKKEGYDIDSFIKAPLLLEQGSVEIEAETPEGVLRCVLDTGSTWNLLNAKTDKPIEQAIWDSDNFLEQPSFRINGHDFGAITFRRVPIQAPVPVEAILGMDFFEEHLVFLDFTGGYVYFAKNSSLL